MLVSMSNLFYDSKRTVAVGKFCATMEKLEKLYTKRPLVYTCPQAPPPNSHLFCGLANGFFFSIFSIFCISALALTHVSFFVPLSTFNFLCRYQNLYCNIDTYSYCTFRLA